MMRLPYSSSITHNPKTDGKLPFALAGHALPSATPSHSSWRSSERNLTSPVSAWFSHPMMLLGNAQVPSVTVRERARFAPEVASRWRSCSALLAALEARRSSVSPACADSGSSSDSAAAPAKLSACEVSSDKLRPAKTADSVKAGDWNCASQRVLNAHRDASWTPQRRCCSAAARGASGPWRGAAWAREAASARSRQICSASHALDESRGGQHDSTRRTGEGACNV